MPAWWISFVGAARRPEQAPGGSSRGAGSGTVMEQFMGYPRADGRVGTRSHVLVVPTVICASTVASRIAAAVPGAVAIAHNQGCNFDRDMNERVYRTFAGLAGNPNVYATLFVGLGCEMVHAEPAHERVAAAGYRSAFIDIQREGGHAAAIERGVRIAGPWGEAAVAERRVPASLEHLILGVECGGSDAFSGLSANPALGVASDRLVAVGGTVILSETTEMLGAEHLLIARAPDPEVKRRIRAMADRDETEVASLGIGQAAGSMSLAPGNVEGGLTTIEEKSLGCIRKGGTAAVVDCLGYGERPVRPGLNLMDTPGYDVQSVTGLAVGGANVIAFTTGRGTPTGCCVAPVVKIASNSRIALELADLVDVSAGGVIDGRATLGEAGDAIFARIVAAASGELTWSERNGHVEFDVAPVLHVLELLERGARLARCEGAGA